MEEIDSYSFQIKKYWRDNQKLPIHFLMTQERSQVLDLLFHLITNSQGAIVLCGPEGIGKTKLLNVLQHQEVAPWLFCIIEGSKELTLDDVHEQLDKSAEQKDKPDKYDRSFNGDLSQVNSKQRKRILVIDNAGALMPGLITQIIQFSDVNPFLSVIFVLTHDQLHLKNSSDQTIQDCHIVEMPPLSEKQCGEFLQHLSTKSSSAMTINALTDEMVANIYKNTHGVPGQIIAEFSTLLESKLNRQENSTKMLVIAVATLIAVALSVQWFSSNRPITESKVAGNVDQQPAEITYDQPFISIPSLSHPGKSKDNYIQLDVDENIHHYFASDSETLLVDAQKNTRPMPHSTMEKDINVPIQPSPNDRAVNIPENMQQPVNDTAMSNGKSETVDFNPDDEASVWLYSQPADNYTLQLMVLSKQQAILEVIKKYPDLKQNFRYVRRLFKGKEKFVLLYGSYADSVSANTVKLNLPKEFRKSLMRKFSAINKEIGPAPTIQ